jgi:hypothetical protein
MEGERVAKFVDRNAPHPNSQVRKERGYVTLYDCSMCEITWEKTTANGKLTIRQRAVDPIDVIADLLDSDNPPEEVQLEIRHACPKLHE